MAWTKKGKEREARERQQAQEEYEANETRTQQRRERSEWNAMPAHEKAVVLFQRLRAGEIDENQLEFLLPTLAKEAAAADETGRSLQTLERVIDRQWDVLKREVDREIALAERKLTGLKGRNEHREEILDKMSKSSTGADGYIAKKNRLADLNADIEVERT